MSADDVRDLPDKGLEVQSLDSGRWRAAYVIPTTPSNRSRIVVGYGEDEEAALLSLAEALCTSITTLLIASPGTSREVVEPLGTALAALRSRS